MNLKSEAMKAEEREINFIMYFESEVLKWSHGKFLKKNSNLDNAIWLAFNVCRP